MLLNGFITSMVRRSRRGTSSPRDFLMVPVQLPNGETVHLSPGNHNLLQRAVVEEFAPRFVPGAYLLYLGDTAGKDLFLDKDRLEHVVGNDLARVFRESVHPSTPAPEPCPVSDQLSSRTSNEVTASRCLQYDVSARWSGVRAPNASIAASFWSVRPMSSSPCTRCGRGRCQRSGESVAVGDLLAG